MSTRRVAGISRCCSGRTRTAARGTSGRVRVRRPVGTSRCSSGRARTAARGMSGRGMRSPLFTGKSIWSTSSPKGDSDDDE